jgi:glycolate oxidase
MATATALADRVLDDLAQIVGPQHVLTSHPARLNRSRTPAMFAVHRWDEHEPQVVVLPATAEEVAEIVRLANRERLPVVPRAGGTGLVDGAVPLRHGILVDVKRMDQVHEIDLDERCATVGPGVNMLKLNERLRPHGVMYPDNPASYACSLVGGRIGTNGWSLLGARFGHVRNLVISFELVLPTGEIIRVGEGGGKKTRSSSSGYRLKELFMGAQGTLGIVTEATVELVKRPEAEFSAFWLQRSYDAAWRAAGEIMRSGYATLAGVMLFDERKVAYLRRDDEAYIPQPDWTQAVMAFALYGNRAEVRPAAKELMRLAKATGGEYVGDEIAQLDWSARHDRYATPLHGRTPNGQVAPMSWHCEDAGIPYPKVPEIRERWHAIVEGLVERHPIFDDWGMFGYTNGPNKPWGDVLCEIDVGIWEAHLDDETWGAWVDAKREIARASIEVGGTISAAHGSSRAGEVDLVPLELGGAYDVMKTIKRTLDPRNVMNPGKYLLDAAYEEG